MATKLKLIEQNFEAKLELIKVDNNNQFSGLQTNLSPQKNQKINPPKCKDSYKVKTLSDKFDDFNNNLKTQAKSMNKVFWKMLNFGS